MTEYFAYNRSKNVKLAQLTANLFLTFLLFLHKKSLFIFENTTKVNPFIYFSLLTRFFQPNKGRGNDVLCEIEYNIKWTDVLHRAFFKVNVLICRFNRSH